MSHWSLSCVAGGCGMLMPLPWLGLMSVSGASCQYCLQCLDQVNATGALIVGMCLSVIACCGAF